MCRFCNELDPDMQAIFLLSEEEANSSLERMIYRPWSYDDIWGILSAEGKGLVNPDSMEDDWEEIDPTGDDVLPCHRWFSSWCVNLAKVGEVTNQHVKKRYTRALTKVGVWYKEPLKDSGGGEELRGREFTYMKAHNFIFPKLLMSRPVDAIHDYRSGSSMVNRFNGGEGKGKGPTPSAPTGYHCGGGKPEDQFKCEHCNGYHTDDTCWVIHPERRDCLQKLLQQASQKKKQMVDYWKRRKCMYCGKDRHPKGTRCTQDPSNKPRSPKGGGSNWWGTFHRF